MPAVLAQWSAVMPPLAAPLLFAFVVALVLVWAAGALARRFGFVAHPREDRWHRRPVALSGGIGIGCTVLLGVLVFQVAPGLALLLTVCALMFVTGVVDDVFGLKPFSKLVVEIGIASLLLSFGYRLNWTTSLTLDTILTLVWVVGMTNAFNLLDHMDGLCAGIALIVGMGLMAGLLPAQPGTEAFYQMRYLALLLGATAGFLVYNRHPASIFMGDSGALTLGLSFAALTLRHASTEPARSNPLSIVAAPVLVLLIPIFDTTLVTASRLLSGRAPSQGGRDHSSHRLVALGLSEPAAVGLLWLLAAVAGAFGVGFDYFNLSWSSPIAALFLIAMAIFAVYLSRIGVYEDDKDAAADPSHRTPLVVDFMYKKQVIEVILDLALATIAYYSSYRLRFEGDDFARNFNTFYRTLPLVAALDVLALFAVGFYRGVWRYFGLMDTVVVLKGVLLGTGAALFFIEYAMTLGPHSHTVFVIDVLLLTTLLTASRVSFRLIAEFLQRYHQTATRIAIYGAGVGGALVARELIGREGAPCRIVGFADDDPAKQGRRVQGYAVVGGYEALASLVRSGAVDTVVVSARIIDLDRLQAIQAVCGDHGVNLLRWRVGLEPLVTNVSAG
jgi:UDP-GlcNAc:undecaprenyl-phosphate GlcNAc-1-phosphate transferase